MKSVLFWMLRHLGIPAGFMLATGIPQYLFEHRNDEPTPRYTDAEFATLEMSPDNYYDYMDSVTASRRKLAAKSEYTTFLYFHDLKQARMYTNKYRNTLPAANRFNLGRTPLTNYENDLANIHRDQAKWLELCEKKDEAEKFWVVDGSYVKPKETGPGFSFPNWLLATYLRGLPMAFLLFLIWKFKLKKEAAPVSFLLALLFWPIILAIDIRNRFNETLKTVDVVSRRGVLFTLLSKQEKQLLEFGKKMTRQEFGEHLDSLGMNRKHSFASAFAVTLLLTITSQLVFSHPVPTTESKEKVVVLKIDKEGSGAYQEHHVVDEISAILPPTLIYFVELFQQTFFITDWLELFDFSPDIGKVPLVMNRTQVSIL